MNAPPPFRFDSNSMKALSHEPGRVDVWLFPLAIPSDPCLQTTDLLSPDEQERARRFHFEGDRIRFVTARATLRKLLGGYLRHDPGQIRFRYGSRGKPQIAEPLTFLHFNLSHSGDWAALAVASEPVGIDIERVHARVEAEALAARFFSPEDQAWLRSHPDEQRQRAFFRLWVAKEAWLKATGDGITFPLDRIVTRFTDEKITAVEESTGRRRWTVRELEPIPGDYCAALATAHPSPQITLQPIKEW